MQFPLRRRSFLFGTLTAGFALAVQPIAAQTMIQTSSDGLVAGAVTIPVADGEIPAYRAMPATGTDFPVILVVQEIFGVHEHIQDLCRRLAQAGYLAIAPELYVRQGDVSKLDSIDAIRPIVGTVPDAQVFSDLDATVLWAASSGKGDTEKLGITGFCWGGRIVWLYAAHSHQLKAGVAWYGRLVGNNNPLQPVYPTELATNLRAPVLGLYGGQDRGIPLDTVEAMQAALKDNDQVTSEIIVYPGAPHGFNADYRQSYREEEAQTAWQEMLAWFKRYGVA